MADSQAPTLRKRALRFVISGALVASAPLAMASSCGSGTTGQQVNERPVRDFAPNPGPATDPPTPTPPPSPEPIHVNEGPQAPPPPAPAQEPSSSGH